MTKAEMSAVMREMGRRGGRIGGKRRLETMTASERSAVASRAAMARWHPPAVPWWHRRGAAFVIRYPDQLRLVGITDHVTPTRVWFRADGDDRNERAARRMSLREFERLLATGVIERASCVDDVGRAEAIPAHVPTTRGGLVREEP